MRRAVGYRRYDTPNELEALNELYSVLRLYTNFFQPSMKLQGKVVGILVEDQHEDIELWRPLL